jgi:hypothetical protein
LGGTIRGLGGVAEQVGGVEDHVHLLMSLRTTDTLADLVREIKKASSVWLGEQFDPLFSWQEGYSIFSVSYTHSLALRRYIQTQEAHHRKTSFLEELKRMLVRNGVKFDPRFLA